MTQVKNQVKNKEEVLLRVPPCTPWLEVIPGQKAALGFGVNW